MTSSLNLRVVRILAISRQAGQDSTEERGAQRGIAGVTIALGSAVSDGPALTEGDLSVALSAVVG